MRQMFDAEAVAPYAAKRVIRSDCCRAEGKSPKFNFNDGTFEYKPVAQLPEDLFAALNRCVISPPRTRRSFRSFKQMRNLSTSHQSLREVKREVVGKGIS